MTRSVAVLHDINSHAVSFERELRRLVGNNFAVYTHGRFDLPASNVELARFVESRPDDVVFHALAAMPVYSSYGDTTFHSIIPICHPMMQTLVRFAGWSRGEWEKANERRLDDSAAVGVMVDFIRDRMRESWRMYPPLNYHLGFLTGQLGASDPATAAETAASLLAGAIPVLADFPNTIVPTVVASLVAVGAPLTGEGKLACDPGNDVIRMLRHWRTALPGPVFDELCALNANDLAFWDAVAPAIAARLPMPQEGRAQIARVIEEAAEITGHRRVGAVAVPRVDAGRGTDLLAEPDPVLGYRYRPNRAFEQTVLGRRIVMETDDLGFRPVARQPKRAEMTFAAYGCSFTYGFVIQADETFCAILQSMFPDWRIENHGINGYGTHQNLVQLERDSHWGVADYVSFCFIPSHLTRNVATASCMQGFSRFTWRSSPIQFYPRACLEPDGNLTLKRVSLKRPEITGMKLDDFDPDPYYLDQVCLALFRRAAAIVHAQGKHFFVTTLRDYPSDYLLSQMRDAGIPFLDAHVPWVDQYTNDPDDGHPNALANQIFAERIQAYILRHMAGDA